VYVENEGVKMLTVSSWFRPKYYVPRNPFQTPDYYPQAQNPVLSTAGIFSQLDVETLFYVFYFLPGTYQQ
jgi:CCR4-NOT transcription complex subunit 3